jgi:hypothetical protein
MSSKAKMIIATVASVAVAGGIVVSSMADSAAEKAVSDMVQKIETQADNELVITYGGVGAGIFSQKVTVEDIEIKTPKGEPVFIVSAMDITADGYVANEKFPTSVEIGLHGLEVVDERVVSKLKQSSGTDYSDRLMNGSVGYDFDKSADTMSYSMFASTSGVSDLSLDGTFSNIKSVWDLFESNYAQNKGELDLDRDDERKFNQLIQNARLNGVEVTYVNNGEVERLLQKAAAESRQSVSDMQERFIPLAIDQYVGQGDIADELKAFASNPEKITVSVNPDEPVTFTNLSQRFMAYAMAGKKDALDSINLDVQAN